jgi:hypothetical protein
MLNTMTILESGHWIPLAVAYQLQSRPNNLEIEYMRNSTGNGEAKTRLVNAAAGQ